MQVQKMDSRRRLRSERVKTLWSRAYLGTTEVERWISEGKNLGMEYYRLAIRSRLQCINGESHASRFTQ